MSASENGKAIGTQSAEIRPRTPEQPQLYRSVHTNQDAKHALGQNLEPKIPEGVVFDRRQQMMPLQQPVKKDSVEETA